MADTQPKESLQELFERIRTRDPSTIRNDFRINKLVYGVVTNLGRDDFAAKQHMKELVQLTSKEEADQMVRKGLQNQKNKKRIV